MFMYNRIWIAWVHTTGTSAAIGQAPQWIVWLRIPLSLAHVQVVWLAGSSKSNVKINIIFYTFQIKLRFLVQLKYHTKNL